jgi:radical SAM superfamily enzyme YgiQ (UPF0313 family)
MKILLISTYELGRQPFGLASPAAMLERAGHRVRCLDLSVQRLDEAAVRDAPLIAFYLPMHTATRIALAVLDKVRSLNPRAHLCAYGLYAPVSVEVLRAHGVRSILGGEFEAGLVSLADSLERAAATAGKGDGSAPEPSRETRLPGEPEAEISLARQQFVVPRRAGLPDLQQYAHLVAADGSSRTVGYTEASRGCKHLCRHCPVVPVYGGRFRVVQPDVVLADIDQQVSMGAQHITFGDPDFFNGPGHAADIVRRLHARHPGLTYDVTVKVEHLLQHEELLPLLRDTGCAFVTSAVEAVDDTILARLDKGHTRADFERAVTLCREVGVALQPTFVAFTPWTTLEGYADLLATIARLDLVDNVPSIQLVIRLLIPAGSRLLDLDEVRALVSPFDAEMLGYPWRHPDARVDRLQRDIQALVEQAGENAARREVFVKAWELVQRAGNGAVGDLPDVVPGRARATIPYLTEPWYC